MVECKLNIRWLEFKKRWLNHFNLKIAVKISNYHILWWSNVPYILNLYSVQCTAIFDTCWHSEFWFRIFQIRIGFQKKSFFSKIIFYLLLIRKQPNLIHLNRRCLNFTFFLEIKFLMLNLLFTDKSVKFQIDFNLSKLLCNKFIALSQRFNWDHRS